MEKVGPKEMENRGKVSSFKDLLCNLYCYGSFYIFLYDFYIFYIFALLIPLPPSVCSRLCS